MKQPTPFILTQPDPFSREALRPEGGLITTWAYFAVEHEPGDGNVEAYGYQVMRSPDDQRLARHALRKSLGSRKPNPALFSYCLVGVREAMANAFEDQVLDCLPGVYCYARVSRETMRRRFIRAV